MASNQPLTFTAQQANSTIMLKKNSSPTAINLQYSVDDGSTWSTFTVGTTYTLANIGDTFQLRATSTNASGMGQAPTKCHQFVMTGRIAANGNIMSLYDKDFDTKSVAMTNSGLIRLFHGCTSLTTPPELPATTLAQQCYQSIFQDCTSLTTAPELPATTMASSCYNGMFSGCTSLTTPPELPATTLAQSCYNGMFTNCTSLTVAPKLPAKTLSQSCYQSMFQGCTSLTSAYELPATTMAKYCYNGMFNGCTSLDSVTASISSNDLALGTYTVNWLNGVASNGTFYYTNPDFDPDDITNRSVSTVPSGWNIVEYQQPLTFTAEEDGSTIQLQKNGSPTTVSLQYSTDGGSTWSTFSVATTYTLESIGDTIQIRATSTNASGMGQSTSKYHYFVMSGKIVASGDVMSLYDVDFATKSIAMTQYGLSFLFKNCTSLTSAPELSATTLASDCYRAMFNGCTSLRIAPQLPATTLTNYCYFYMFADCTSLTEAPELPATTMKIFCYQNMFDSCTSLTVAPELPATTLASDCYQNMFRGCTSLRIAPQLPATTLADYCYQNMFYGCTSLTEAPELQATTMKTYCYGSMFNSCTSLAIAPELPATTLAQSCYNGMFYGCTSLTEAPELSATTLSSNCYTSMFRDCSSLTQAPELPATSVVSSCYSNMFNGCTSLNSVTAAISSEDLALGTYTNSWLNGVASEGTYTYLDPDFDPNSITRGVDTVPTGWIIAAPHAQTEFYLAGDLVKTFALNGKYVKTLYINGNQVLFNGEIGPTPRNTNFRLTNIGNSTDYPSDTWRVEIHMPTECDMQVYHSDSGETTSLTAGDNIITLPYGEYLEFEGDNQHGLYPDDDYFHIVCPSSGAYEASGKLKTLAQYDTKEGHSFYALFSGNGGLRKADRLTIPTGYNGSESAFESMFSGCTNLTSAPDTIPPNNGKNCYKGMFNGCANLNSVGVRWTEWPSAIGAETEICTTGWMTNAGTSATNPTFKCPSTLVIADRDNDFVPSNFTITH